MAKGSSYGTVTQKSQDIGLRHQIVRQVHDKELYEVKASMHKLYAVKRAQHPTMIV